MAVTGLPAKCTDPRCGAIFESALPAGIWSTDNLTNCPECGATAHIVNVVPVEEENGVDEFYPIDPVSQDVTARWRAMKDLGRRAKQKGDDLDITEVIAQAAQIDPEFAEKLVRGKNLPVIAFFIFFFLMLKMCQGGVSINIDNSTTTVIEQHAQDYVEQRPGEDIDPEKVPLPPGLEPGKKPKKDTIAALKPRKGRMKARTVRRISERERRRAIRSARKDDRNG